MHPKIQIGTVLKNKPHASQIDMMGKKCKKCKKGKYKETSQMDDLKGVLHCDKCGDEIERYMGKNSSR